MSINNKININNLFDSASESSIDIPTTIKIINNTNNNNKVSSIASPSSSSNIFTTNKQLSLLNDLLEDNNHSPLSDHLLKGGNYSATSDIFLKSAKSDNIKNNSYSATSDNLVGGNEKNNDYSATSDNLLKNENYSATSSAIFLKNDNNLKGGNNENLVTYEQLNNNNQESITSSDHNNTQLNGDINKLLSMFSSESNTIFNNKQLGGTTAEINKLLSMLSSESSNNSEVTSTSDLEDLLHNKFNLDGGKKEGDKPRGNVEAFAAFRELKKVVLDELKLGNKEAMKLAGKILKDYKLLNPNLDALTASKQSIDYFKKNKSKYQ